MVKFIFILLIMVQLISCIKPGPNCIEDCNKEWSNVTIKTRICSTWKTSHFVSPDALTKNCYSGCQLGVLYPGTCECPNHCHINTNQGRCTKHGCVCHPNWKGISCSVPNIPVNSYLPLNPIPFGDIFGDHFYSNKEKYKDDHPVFNVSRIATFYVKVSEYDLIHLLNSTNMFNNTWLRTEINFDNGLIKESLKDVGIRLKGSGGRMQRKKGFKLSFTSFGNKGRKFYGLRRIGFKGQQENLTGVKSFISSELYRSMSVPVQRGSFSKVFINEIFYGVYWMSEEIEKEFVASRYKGGKGDLYRCFISGFEYLGDDENTYKNLNISYGGRYRRHYDKKLGEPENYSNLLKFITMLNKTSDEEFPKEIKKIFNVESFLRQLVVEISIGNFDSYTVNHNNYMIYEDSKSKIFQFITFDFDLTFWEGFENVNVYEWEKLVIPFFPVLRTSPLTVRIMRVPEFRNRFTELFRIYLRRVFHPNSLLIKRLKNISNSLRDHVKQDLFYPLDYFLAERTFEYWIKSMKMMEEFIVKRFNSAMIQLDK
jgi:spore coat protein H